MNEELVEFAKCSMEIARKQGYALVTFTFCPACKRSNYHTHHHSGSVVCQNDGCKERYPANTFAPPVKGELTVDHLVAAMQVVRDGAIQEAAKYNLPPVPGAELEKLPPKVLALMTRHSLQSTRHAVEKVHGLALAMATTEVT